VETRNRAPEVVEAPDALGPVTWLLLAILGGMLAGGLGLAGTLTPVRCLVSLTATVIVVGVGLLAINGLWRGQWWALLCVRVLIGLQLLIGLLLAIGIHPFFFLLPDGLGLLAGFAVAAAVPIITSASFSDWVSESDLRSQVLSWLAVVLIIGGSVGSAAAASMPDPTQVSQDALIVRAAASCRTGSATVTVDVTWSQTDLWPKGPFGHMSDMVEVLLDDQTPGGPDPIGTMTGSFQWTVTDRSARSSASPVVTTVGPAQTLTPDTWAATGDAAVLVIAHDALQAGHDYHIVGTSPTNMPSQLPKRAVIDYRHGDRFTKTVEVGCGA
jgi:hypothetical protein